MTGAVVLAAGGAAIGAAPAAAAPFPATQTTAVDSPSGGRLHPVTPARLLDTREQGGRVQAGNDRELQVLGRGGVPESGVSAVVLNVTVTGGTQRDDLQVYPVGQRPPRRTSNLNWKSGETVPVQVQTAVGDGGKIAFSVYGGAAHVVVDVFGWYDDGSQGGTSTGSGYTALAPNRLLDTRETGGAVEAGTPRTVQVTGNAGVPAGATAVMLNATMLGTPANADLQVFPVGQRPERRTSNLNVSRGEMRANAVMTPVGDDGRIGLSVSQNTAHVVLDVVGYYSGDSAARFVSVSPNRILDTREKRDPVRAGNPRSVQVSNRGSVPSNAAAAVLNVTATAASVPLDLQVFPVGDRPERRTSTLNLREGMAVPNLAVATLGSGGQIGLSPSQGSVHVVLDVFGYMTSATWSQCRNPQGGWTAQYPGDWRTNSGAVIAMCRVFLPQPFTLREGTEIPLGLAVQLRREPVSIDRARNPQGSRQLSDRQTSVDGRTAYRQEREQTEDTTIPAGTRYTVWLVDVGNDETVFATSYAIAEPAYDRKVAVLDEMMRRLDLHGDGGSDGGGSGAPAFPDSISPSSSDASADARLTVADVRTGAHDGFDRVVFDLGGSGTPGWQVQYRDTVQEQGTGREVELAGNANLRILIRGTVAPTASDEPYYDGPDKVTPNGTSNAQEVYMGTWYEGMYDAAVGLRSAQPFRVFALSNPNRLVVDVKTAPWQSALQVAAVDADAAP